jgi:D-alanine--poly(phosphoribitol) ligase subunit 2
MSKQTPDLPSVMKLVIQLCEEHNEIAEPERQIDLSDPNETRLYGRQGVLDSLGLVSLLAAIEQAMEEQYDLQVTLADERAFSQARSPFRTVASLAEYIHGLCGGNDV